MSDYLGLVNKVIQESGLELDELTVGTWSSAEAGRRIYPRIKRNVAEAWKLLQMKRDQWEFKTAELTTVVLPRVKFQNGSRAAGSPAPGTIFIGQTSGFQLTVSQVLLEDGSWTLGTAKGQIEFSTFTGSQLVVGEEYAEQTPGTGTFDYLEKGSYDFSDVDPLFDELAWTTMVAYSTGSTPVPVVYMPWENWTYQEASFTQGSITPPAYYSEDPFGHIVFYPQMLQPFNVNFVYSQKPQTLTDPDDVPVNISAEFHDWIAWEALKILAAYDKNPDLFGYAKGMAEQYARKAESNLMPKMSWGESRYNDPTRSPR